ncbi:MAG: hypothetical protein RL095_3852 [Verrucomicrobiota bacterium]|jgi:uncharacterized protein YdiU (UPF0061 family)
MHTLESLPFSSFYAALGPEFGAALDPDGYEDASLVAFNDAVAGLIGLDAREAKRQEMALFCGGAWIPASARPFAQVYAGHQFGGWSWRLGDGRGLLLGELPATDGKIYDLHLKGAGLTPWSRMGDGRAVLRSTLREFIGGEALFALGVPSTRALAFAVSSQPVQRETLEPGAMLLRLARTHIRFGSFEYFAHNQMPEQRDRLLRHVLERHYPDAAKLSLAEGAAHLFRAAVRSSAEMVAGWQAVGFVHGVMNTDNMSILGESFDFGPYAFLDSYDPEACPNHSDPQGRYRFSNQPAITFWNLKCLAAALLPVLDKADAVAALEDFASIYHDAWARRFALRLGFRHASEISTALAQAWLALLARHRADFALCFRRLSSASNEIDPLLQAQIPEDAALLAWWQDWRQALRECGDDDETLQARLDAVNPLYLPRSWILQEAIDAAARGDFQPVRDLLHRSQNPFVAIPGADRYSLPPEPSQSCSELSCSS